MALAVAYFFFFQELFSSVGAVEKASVKYDGAGRSSGEATVVFKSPSSVQKAIDVRYAMVFVASSFILDDAAFQEFDGRMIDNQKMTVADGGTIDLAKRKPRAPKPTREEEEEPRPRGRGLSTGSKGMTPSSLSSLSFALVI